MCGLLKQSKRMLPSVRNPRLGFRRSFTRRSDDDAAEHHAAFFAALEVDGAGERFVTVESAASNSGNFSVVDDGRTIQYDRNCAADQSNVVRLPLVGGAGGLRGRSEETVNTAQAPLGRISDGIGFELDFIAAAQIDAAVRFRAAIELDVQLEIFKFRVVDQFGAVSGSDEQAIFYFPRG